MGLESFVENQTNGQVEVVNKIIKYNLKMKLEEHKGLWADKLPKVGKSSKPLNSS